MGETRPKVPVGQYFIVQNGQICTWLPSPDNESGAWAPLPIDPYVVLAELQMERTPGFRGHNGPFNGSQALGRGRTPQSTEAS